MSRKFTLMAIMFCVCLIASNLFETKIFNAGIMTLTGGFLIFPVSYILNDCITEIYGLKKMQFVIITAFAMNAFFVLMAQVVRILPPAEFWDGQEHIEYMFNADFRITIASMAAFVCGSLINAKIMALMKQKKARGGFCSRAVVSSLFGETVDSLIFFPIAFWGVGLKNLAVMMTTQIILKTLYEIFVLPLTNFLVKRLKREQALPSGMDQELKERQA